MTSLPTPAVVPLIVLTLLTPAAASAQWPSWEDRVLASLNVVVSPTTPRTIQEGFEYDDPYQKPLPPLPGLPGSSNFEQASVITAYRVPRPASFDGSAAVRIAGGLGLGLAVSSRRGTSDMTVDARIPHPSKILEPREVEGTVAAEYAETALHFQAVFVVPLSSRFRMAVSAGPTHFSVARDRVTSVAVNEAPPFDTASFRDAALETFEAGTWGFNVGADVAWMFARHLGVGAMVRYSYGNLRLSPEDAAALDAGVGGWHIGGGARFAF